MQAIPINHWQIALNYCYTSPKQNKGSIVYTYVNESNMRKDTTYYAAGYTIADIASHKANAIINYSFLKHYNINMRVNYVGSKKTGAGTTAPRNLVGNVNGYCIANVTAGINNIFNIKGTTLQLICNNILNKGYFSPGIRTAGGINYPNRIWQMQRNFSIRLDYDF